jgi:acyl-CoA dehydrogenase
MAGGVDVAALAATLTRFVEEECIPAEAVFEEQLRGSGGRWGVVPPVLTKLKQRAK